MPPNFKSSEDADVFRLKDGEVRPLLRDKGGNLFEPVAPGSEDDPFRFLPQNLIDVLYGLQKVELALQEGNSEVALAMLQRCQAVLRTLVGAELKRALGLH